VIERSKYALELVSNHDEPHRLTPESSFASRGLTLLPQSVACDFWLN
jgi:hypothetical protein